MADDQPLSLSALGDRWRNMRLSDNVEDYRNVPLDPMRVSLGDGAPLQLSDLQTLDQKIRAVIGGGDQPLAFKRGMFDDDIERYGREGAQQGEFGLTGPPADRFGITLTAMSPTTKQIDASALSQIGKLLAR